MRVSYKKLWMLLIEKDMTKADLRKKAEIAPSTLTKLNKNEYIALSILVKICDALDCDFGDIMEIVKKEDNKKENI